MKKENFIFNPNKKITKNNGNFDVEDELYFYCKTDKKDYPLIDYYGDTTLGGDDDLLWIDLEAYLEEIDSFYILSKSEERDFKKDEKKWNEYKKQKIEINKKIKNWKKFFENRKEIFLNQNIRDCWKYLLDYQNRTCRQYGVTVVLYKTEDGTYIIEQRRCHGESVSWLSSELPRS